MRHQPEVVIRKLEQMAEYLERLDVMLRGLTQPVYVEEWRQRHLTERLVELIVEEGIDINMQLLGAAGKPPPADYYHSFTALATLHVYPQTFARRVAWTTGLRNHLIHEYAAVDNIRVFRWLRPLHRAYRRYMRYVSAYLNRPMSKRS